LAKERLVQPQIAIEQPGYIYIILYNRSNSALTQAYPGASVTLVPIKAD
jgi:hypothetical protein